MIIEETIRNIGEPDLAARQRMQEHLDSLIKPPGSLGALEDAAVKLAGIHGTLDLSIRGKCVILAAGDHGVVDEGVSVAPREITYQIIPAFLNGTSGVGVLARHAGARLVVIDAGVAASVDFPGVRRLKVRPGTANLARGPAMSRAEAVQAVEAGIAVAEEEIGRGADLLATGDMGIGNTTPSAAILAVLGGYPPREAAGRGTLVNDEVLERKIEVIERAIEVNRPDPSDPLDVLAKVGGLEIAALAGVILGAAGKRVPVVLDGFITTAAALVAARLAPRSVNFLFAGHLSGEQGHRLMLEMLGLSPLLNLGLRLGEGTGAALAMHLVEAAAKIATQMATFATAQLAELNEDMIAR